jgi:hypothetical protein
MLRVVIAAFLMLQPLPAEEFVPMLRKTMEKLGAPAEKALESPPVGSECISIQQVRLAATAGNAVWLRVRCNGGARREIYARFLYANESEVREAAKAAGKKKSGEIGTGPVLVRAGARVDLLVRMGSVRLHEPVLAMAAGKMGQTVRVKDGRRRILTARVAGRNRLEAAW